MEIGGRLFCVALMSMSAFAAEEMSWTNEAQEPKVRAQALVKEMSLEEKADELHMHFMGASNGYSLFTNRLAQGRTFGTVLKIQSAREAHEIQKMAIAASRLRIPVLYTEDVTHGFRTILPVGLGSACTWDEKLVEDAEAMAAREAVAGGFHLTYAPMCDISDDPRWGRICETSGEDPYLSGRLTAARIRGFHRHFASCIKHYAGYAALRAGRDYHPVDFSVRDLQETYLVPYRAAMAEGVDQVMCAYTPFDAGNCTLNKFLNIDVLRGELGFEGSLITDWQTIKSCLRLGLVHDIDEAVEKAMKSGIDGDMVSYAYGDILPKLVREGRVSEMRLDEACVRSLTLKFKLGLFDDPFRYGCEAEERTVQFTLENRAIARQVVREGVVLLENRGCMLPLSRHEKVTVAGPLANAPKDQLGDWSCAGRTNETVTILQGVSEAWQENFVDEEKAAVIIYCAGEYVKWGGEHKSRMNPVVPNEQVDEIRRLKSKGKRVVAVVLSSRPLVLTDLIEAADAALFSFFPGTEGGHGIADVLIGEENPCGRLVQTFPRSVGQIPISYRERRAWMYDEWVDGSTKPLYPFGYGLSYTRFSCGVPKWKDGAVEVCVTNEGKRSGASVVQLYMRQEVSPIVQRERELKGFCRVLLSPGESRVVRFPIDASAFKYFGGDHLWHRSDGEACAYVGFDAATTNGIGLACSGGEVFAR